jgi:uncharacterized protein with ParB-like and HNH nuclease domain
MTTITPHYRTIKQLLQSQIFDIDEYQREYKWEKENIDELLSDLQGQFFSSYRPGDDTQKVSTYGEYFLGSIIVSKRDERNYLIDGQQRITSLTLLLIYLYRAAMAEKLSIAQTIAPLIYSDNFGVPKFNLDIEDRLPVISALFEGKPFNPDGKDESLQTMYARYTNIETNDLIIDLGDALPHFTYWLMTKVGLIEIATDNDNYAYAIFETMNDRGKPLSPVDMLKAYLLAAVKNAILRQTANDVWKKQVLELISWGGTHAPERDANAIKAWLRAQYAESIRERKANATDKDWEIIGSTFHRWVRDNEVRLKLKSEIGNYAFITENFPFFAKAYRVILEASRTYTKGLEPVFYNAHNDFTWQNTVLLAPLTISDDDDTMRRKLAITATFLDIWLIRRVVNYIRVGYSSASYTMYLLCKDIRGKSVDELVNILLGKLAENDATFDGSPSRGRIGVDALGLNQFSRRYIYHILARVSAYVDVQAGRTDSFDKYVDRNVKNPFDIEHIWADRYDQFEKGFDSQQDFQNWRNHIASLVLLPADVNRSLQDKPFHDKVPHYGKQNFYAASMSMSVYQHQPQFDQFMKAKNLAFKPYQSFGKTEQMERRALLKDLMNQIWSEERLKAFLE